MAAAVVACAIAAACLTMPGKFTKWPQPPDPRRGHFGARGFDPPFAAPAKIAIRNLTINELTLYWLNPGWVLDLFSTTDSETVYWSASIDPLDPRCFLYLFGYNPPNPGPDGGSVEWYIQFQVLTIAIYEGRVVADWPIGGWVPPSITCVELFPNPLPMTGPVELWGVPWDTPSGSL